MLQVTCTVCQTASPTTNSEMGEGGNGNRPRGPPVRRSAKEMAADLFHQVYALPQNSHAESKSGVVILVADGFSNI